MLFEKTYGIDLGNDAVRIYSDMLKKTYQEKNMIAARGREIIAVGDEAAEMEGKEPASIKVKSPMAFGMISELELQEIVIYTLLNRMTSIYSRGSVFYFSAPPDMSKIEKRAYYYVVNGHWLRQSRVFMVESPIADALALEIPLEKNPGSMIVNMGCESTSFSVLTDGKIIMSRRIPKGGRQMTESILQEVRRDYHINIGFPTGQRLKHTLGRMDDQVEESMNVVGIDSVSGLPREESISSDTVNAGIENCLEEIILEMKTFLERIPPQIADHIAKEGIHLTGGGTRLPYLDSYLAVSTGFLFQVSSLYEQSTLAGLEKVIQTKELRTWAIPVTERKL